MASAARSLAAMPRRPLLVIAPVTALVVLVLGILGYALLHGVGGARDNALVGRPAPEFRMTTFDGAPVELSALRGSPVVINFWGSWCVPCKDEAPVLQQAWTEFRGQGVQFVGVATWDKEDAAKAFARNAGAVWLNGMDSDGKISIDYGVYGVPETYFVDRQGVLVDRYVGPFIGADGTSRLATYLRKLAAA